MTVMEVLEKAQKLRPGTSLTDPEAPMELMALLNRIEAGVQTDMLLMFRPEAIYRLPEDEDESLLIPPPYDDMYVLGLLAEIDNAMGDLAQHNNSVAKFNQRQADAQKWIIRNFDPKHHPVTVKRQDKEIQWGKETTVTLYGLPVDREDAASATVNISQQGESRFLEAMDESQGVIYDGKKMTVTLGVDVAKSLKEGGMNMGYTITDSDGVTFVNRAVVRLYVVKEKEMGVVTNGE